MSGRSFFLEVNCEYKKKNQIKKKTQISTLKICKWGMKVSIIMKNTLLSFYLNMYAKFQFISEITLVSRAH